MADVVEKKIDALANAVAQGFKEVGGRLERVEGRLDRVEGRLSIVEQKIDLLRADVGELRFDYKKVVTRIENLELKAFGSVQE